MVFAKILGACAAKIPVSTVHIVFLAVAKVIILVTAKLTAQDPLSAEIVKAPERKRARKMAVIRIFRWTCDRCGITAEKHDYGLPSEWIWIPNGFRGVLHRCGPCQEKAKKAEKERSERAKKILTYKPSMDLPQILSCVKSRLQNGPVDNATLARELNLDPEYLSGALWGAQDPQIDFVPQQSDTGNIMWELFKG